ncbi:hypothetical protein Tco_1381311 [Tanacetum coccineum]
MLAKFINEGRHEHKEMEIFIKEFRTTNELLLKKQSNLLSELEIKENELSKVVSNFLIPKNKVKGVTTRGGNMTSEATRSKESNETGFNKDEPSRFEQDVQEKSHDNGVENKSSSIRERTTQPLVKPQQSSVPFPNQSLLTNKSRLEESCMETMNERCSAVLLNELPSKEKNPKSFTTPCQVLGKHKEAEDLAADHLSRFDNPHMEVLTKREIADKFSDDHLMMLKSMFNDDEQWYADSVNYIVGKVVPPNWTIEKRKRFSRKSRLASGKNLMHLNIENKAHWALKQCNIDLTLASESHFMQLNELDELRDGAYENTRIYKERTKKLHDLRLHGDKDFKVGDQVLLFNSRLKMYPGKLKSKWSGPNIFKTVYPHEAIEITDKDGFSFKVNGQRLKKITKVTLTKRMMRL